MSRKKLILSTGNSHKIEEIKNILKELPIDILSKNGLNIEDFEVEEDGETLEENAVKKALALKEKIDGMIIADDTGLFVDCLNGEPGVHSARYAGEDSTDSENNKKLLNKLEGVPMKERGAYFRTIIALITENNDIITVSGTCRGKIDFEPKGNKGFGYDPLFIVEGYDKTFGELGEEIKNKISHRARALDKLKEELIKVLEDDTNENIRSK